VLNQKFYREPTPPSNHLIRGCGCENIISTSNAAQIPTKPEYLRFPQEIWFLFVHPEENARLYATLLYFENCILAANLEM
jgi:hypothetical protein